MFYGRSTPSSQIKVVPVGNNKNKVTIENVGEHLGEFFQALPALLATLLSTKTSGEGFERRPTLMVADVSSFTLAGSILD